VDLTIVILFADPCTDAEERGISVDVSGASRIKILQGGGGVDTVEENKQGRLVVLIPGPRGILLKEIGERGGHD
jgi:carbon monoxide dehydrogenase subunit G